MPRRAAVILLAVAMAWITVAGLGVPAWADLTDVRSLEWWIQRWGLQDVWEISQGRQVTVAVIDTGVEAARSEFDGAVLPGIDLTDGNTGGRVDSDPKSHGTRIAMLIAARGDLRSGMIGVAPAANILPITLGLAGRFPDAGGFGSAKAIHWAVDHGATVVNMSYAGPNAGNCPRPLQDAIWYALDHSAILVGGAGNDGNGINQPEVPALCPGVIAVGAVDDQGRPWSDTERQNYVDVAAPGVNMVSINKSGMPTQSNGTSDAAALVSGAVALLRARFPDMPARQIVTRLLATAKDAGPPGKDDQTGYGIVRPLNALTEDVPADAPNPVYEEVDRLRGVSTSAPAPRASDGGSNLPLVLGIAGVTAVLAALAAFLAVLAGRRRRRTPTAAPPYPPGFRGGPPPGWGRPRGP